MDMSKVYYDVDGNKRNIRQMIKVEPDWSANRLQEGEKAIEALDRLKLRQITSDESTWPEEGVNVIIWRDNKILLGVKAQNIPKGFLVYRANTMLFDTRDGLGTKACALVKDFIGCSYHYLPYGD